MERFRGDAISIVAEVLPRKLHVIHAEFGIDREGEDHERLERQDGQWCCSWHPPQEFATTVVLHVLMRLAGVLEVLGEDVSPIEAVQRRLGGLVSIGPWVRPLEHRPRTGPRE